MKKLILSGLIMVLVIISGLSCTGATLPETSLKTSSKAVSCPKPSTFFFPLKENLKPEGIIFIKTEYPDKEWRLSYKIVVEEEELIIYPCTFHYSAKFYFLIGSPGFNGENDYSVKGKLRILIRSREERVADEIMSIKYTDIQINPIENNDLDLAAHLKILKDTTPFFFNELLNIYEALEGQVIDPVLVPYVRQNM